MDYEQQEDRIAALLDALDTEHARVREAMTELKATGATLQQAVKSAAASAMQEALKDLQGDVERARGVVTDLQRFSLRRAAWQHAWVALVTIAITLLAVWWYVPSVSQMQALRGEKAQLEASIQNMNKRGAKIVIEDCAGRLCIEASTNQGDGGNAFKAYWRDTPSGVPLVIPKGY